ncbi:MAG TPA: SurA N-terminal domain-containing protein, partial [Nitrococcus sp.]|nr:SurA N-terminal domain-containing protein [Nitrococcus sp.]
IAAYIIIGLLIIPFALFGVYNYFTGGSNPPVATVDGIKITRTELDNAVQRQQAQMRQMLGDQYNPAMFNAEHLRQRVLDQLINQAVLLHFVHDHGFRVTDEALSSFIRSQPYFLVNGRFSNEHYRAVLRQNGYSVDQYEAQLRQEQLVQQLESGVAATSIVTEHDLAQFVALERQSRELAWLKIDSASFRNQSQVSDKAIQQYYDAHKQAFQRPAQVQISYIDLSKDALASQLKLDEKAVRQFYEEFKGSRFTTPAARDIRGILIKVPENASKQQVEAARKQIEALRQKIVQGADFAEIARHYSQDVGSARLGGDLGFIRRGETAEAVGKVAFRLPVGQISEPIRSRFGWHLIEVVAVRPEAVKPFTEVEPQIRKELLEQRMTKRFYELSNQVANYAYEHPDSLKPVAEKYGLKIQQSGWFSQSGAKDGIASHPEIVKAAFSNDVLKQGLNSESIALDDARQIILRVDQQKPAAVLALAQVQDRIRDRLIASSASEKAQALGAKLLQEARSGHSLNSLAKGERVQYSDAGWVQRGSDSDKVPAAVIEQGFRLPQPSAGKRSLAGVELPDGGYAVLEVRGVRDGDMGKLSTAERERVRQTLYRSDSEHTLQAMVYVLRQQADIKLDRKQSLAGPNQ